MRRLTLVAAFALALAVPASATAVNDPLRGAQWNLSMVESDAAHATSTGRGALVAVIDTGVKATHPDLIGGRLLAGYDFVQNDSVPQDTVDGHGTHVLGIIGATENNAIGVASVAPGARLLPVRVLGEDGSGLVADVVRGIDYAIAQGAHVINLSLGGDPIFGRSSSFDAAVDRALDAGRVVVAAAGNDYFPACSQPSGRGRLLCVGAVDRRAQKSSFSNYGFGLGLVAPGGSGAPAGGENVLSTFIGPDYDEIAGTSQAAPHVAGVAALLTAKGLSGGEATRQVLATARDIGARGPDFVYGAGIVNARAAVAGLPADGTAAVPTAPGSAARISMRRRDRIRSVLRRGIRVRCRAAGSGRCRVRATRRAKTLGYRSRPVALGRSTLVVARMNRRGRATLRRALRQRKRIVVRVRVTLPGISPQLRRLTLLP